MWVLRQSVKVSTLLLGSVVLTAFLSWFFYNNAAVDIGISQFFYRSHCFVLVSSELANVLRSSLYWLVYSITGIALVSTLVIGVQKKRLSKKGSFILLSFLLGPGLITNVVLKNHWGRPRPREVSTFSGAHPYEKVWVMSHQCQTNCSFVSGDAAGGIILLALPMVMRRFRRWAASFVLSYSFLLGVIRIAQGGHFFSDVCLAFAINITVLLFCYRFCLGNLLWQPPYRTREPGLS